MSLSNTLTIGGHVSAAGGPSKAPERASKFSFNTFQIFSKNQMQWKTKPIPEDEVKGFLEEVKKYSMRDTMVHASYLINLGTPDAALHEKALNGMKVELERVELLDIDLLTFHPGSSKDTNEKQSLTNIADSLNSVLQKEQKSKILLETAAGQGTNVGYSFEQLAEIIEQVEMKDKVGVCFDTCHVWASGYDIKSPEGYAETMDRFKSILGLERLNGFHLNDSKKGQGSRVDRHEQIGDGTIGAEGIGNFINDKRFREIPMILETPKGEEGYDKDLKVLSSVFQEER